MITMGSAWTSFSVTKSPALPNPRMLFALAHASLELVYATSFAIKIKIPGNSDCSRGTATWAGSYKLSSFSPYYFSIQLNSIV